MFIEADGRSQGRFGSADRDAPAQPPRWLSYPWHCPRCRPRTGLDWLIEPAPPRIVIAGGGHVARAIARQALMLDFDVTIVEDRPEFGTRPVSDATIMDGDVPTALRRFLHLA